MVITELSLITTKDKVVRLATQPGRGAAAGIATPAVISLNWTPAQFRLVPPLLALPVTDLPIDIEYILYMDLPA